MANPLVRTTTDIVQANASASVRNMQQFSVNRNGVATPAILNAVPTKIPFTTAEFDINSGFDFVNSRFTPIPGSLFKCRGAIQGGAPAGTVLVVMVYRNGVQYKSGAVTQAAVAAALGSFVEASDIVPNGAYYELWVNQVSGGPIAFAGANTDTWFQGECLG